MFLKGTDMKKYEYARDIFVGTCELNDYESILIPCSKDGKLTGDSIGDCLKLLKNDCKCYFQSPVFDKKERFEFVALSKGKNDVYIESEIINMSVKFLFNLDEYELTVTVGGSGDHKELLENLDTLDIAANSGAVDLDENYDKELSFDVYIGDSVIVHGGANYGLNFTYFKVDYEALERVYEYTEKIQELDVYINPENKKCVNDAFIIGTNLKDAGFKVVTNYSLEDIKEEDIRSNFLITFDEKDIANYQVKLKDLKTKEVHTVKIDNLVEELAFL